MKSQKPAYAPAMKGGILSQGSNSLAAGFECSWQRHLIGLLPIAALYLVLGFYQIDAQSLWTDEVISVRRTSQAASLLMSSQSPLYFSLLVLWTETAGETELALRSLSAVLGLVAIVLVYVVGLRLFNRRIALVATLIMATSPYFIWYAQEVRYITLLIATSLAMTYSFHRALSSSTWHWWALYGFTSALALFTFLTVVFLVAAHGLFLLCRTSGRPFLKKWLASQLIVVILFAAWFIDRTAHRLQAIFSSRPVVVSSDQGRSRQRVPVTDVVGAIPYTFFTFSTGFSLGPSLKDLHESRSVDDLLSHAPLVVPVAILFASLFALGLRRLRREPSMDLFLLLWLGVPVLGVFTIATITTYHVYNTRYVAMVLPAYLVILARGIAEFRRPGMQNMALAAVLCVNGISLSNYYFDPRYGREDARSAARYLEEAAGSKDIILVVGHPRPLRYYYKGALPVETIDARGRNSRLVAEKLRKLADRHNRLWLVEIRSHQRDRKAKVKSTLDMLARRGQHKKFPGVDIYAYDPVSSEQQAVSREQ